MTRYDPRRRCTPFHIDPLGWICSLCSFCRGARCGFVSKTVSRQGGLTALRCILPYAARVALFCDVGRIGTSRHAFQMVTHV